MLSEYLAPRVAHLHVVEVDRSLEAAARGRARPVRERDAAPADAVRLDLARARPGARRRSWRTCPTASPPPCCSSRSRSCRRRSSGWRWCSARWASGSRRRPAAKTYGATSVLAQLACDVRVLRACRARSSTRSRTSSRRSSCCGARRPRRRAELVALVHAGFAHRRKALAGLAGAGARARRRTSATPRARRSSELGHPPDARAERLAPADWRGCAELGRERLAAAASRGRIEPPRSVIREHAFAKLNLVLHVGPPARRTACTRSARCSPRIDLADEVTASRGGSGEDSVDCAGVTGHNLALAALEAFRARAGRDLPPRARAHRQAHPRRRRARRRQRRRRGGAADRQRASPGIPLDPDGLRELAAALGADVPSQVEPRHALVRARASASSRSSCRRSALVLVPDRGGPLHRRGLRGARPARRRPRAARRRAAARARRRRAPPTGSRAALENDLEPAALSLRPELASTLDAPAREPARCGAAVSGSGPTCFGLFATRGSRRGGRGDASPARS